MFNPESRSSFSGDKNKVNDFLVTSLSKIDTAYNIKPVDVDEFMPLPR